MDFAKGPPLASGLGAVSLSVEVGCAQVPH